jgi:hypothetical protein
MKNVFLLLILGSCMLHAQTYYMNVRLKGGSTTSIGIQDIQKLTFSGVTAVGKGRLADIINSFSLLQNYPNPFNPSTTIEFQIPRPGNVEIRIFNLVGLLVRAQVSECPTAGAHKFIWDARSNSGHTVASGVYIYQIAFDNSVVAKRMLFIK